MGIRSKNVLRLFIVCSLIATKSSLGTPLELNPDPDKNGGVVNLTGYSQYEFFVSGGVAPYKIRATKGNFLTKKSRLQEGEPQFVSYQEALPIVLGKLDDKTLRKMVASAIGLFGNVERPYIQFKEAYAGWEEWQAIAKTSSDSMQIYLKENHYKNKVDFIETDILFKVLSEAYSKQMDMKLASQLEPPLTLLIRSPATASPYESERGFRATKVKQVTFDTVDNADEQNTSGRVIYFAPYNGDPVITVLDSTEKNDSQKEPFKQILVHIVPPKMTISSMEPKIIPADQTQQITIHGQGFHAPIVFFNGKSLKVDYWDQTTVKLTLPAVKNTPVILVKNAGDEQQAVIEIQIGKITALGY